jgi:hypothetical protein
MPHMTETKQEPTPALNVIEPDQPPPRPHPLFGCLKGMITIAPGVDLTEPADPELADWIDEKYGNGKVCDE